MDEYVEKHSKEPQKSVKPVAKSGESGIINEKSKKPITPITESAINKVPKSKILGYIEEQCAFIQQQHKELLTYSKENNDCKEVAFVFDSNLTLASRKEFTGTDDRLDFGNNLYGKDLFVMHNHLRNSSFSLVDIAFFWSSDNIKTLTIVKNNGSIEYITKCDNYDFKKLKVEYDRMYKKIVVKGTDSEKDKLVKALLNKTKAGVLWSDRK